MSKLMLAQEAMTKLIQAPAFRENNELFLNAFKAVCSYHYDLVPDYRFHWELAGLHPEELESIDDLEKVPLIMVNQFKKYPFSLADKSKLVLTLGSSGTTGQRSVMYLDDFSLKNVKEMALKIHRALEIVKEDDETYHYLCFTYDPKVADDLGTAFTDELLTSFTPKGEVIYALQWDGEEFKLNEELVIAKLKEFAQAKTPVRILGFPAFLVELIKKYNLNLSLAQNSWIQTGGGWKQYTGEILSKAEFKNLVHEKLGVAPENVRDMLGMIEHGVPYMDWKDGEFRIPNYARVLIRDPQTMAVLPHSEKGLLQLFCAYNTLYPHHSVVMGDYASVLPANENFSSAIINFHGRAGVKKHSGCALTALKFLGDDDVAL